MYIFFFFERIKSISFPGNARVHCTVDPARNRASNDFDDSKMRGRSPQVLEGEGAMLYAQYRFRAIVFTYYIVRIFTADIENPQSIIFNYI